jgi:hypothetical protein
MLFNCITNLYIGSQKLEHLCKLGAYVFPLRCVNGSHKVLLPIQNSLPNCHFLCLQFKQIHHIIFLEQVDIWVVPSSENTLWRLKNVVKNIIFRNYATFNFHQANIKKGFHKLYSKQGNSIAK